MKKLILPTLIASILTACGGNDLQTPTEKRAQSYWTDLVSTDISITPVYDTYGPDYDSNDNFFILYDYRTDEYVGSYFLTDNPDGSFTITLHTPDYQWINIEVGVNGIATYSSSGSPINPVVSYDITPITTQLIQENISNPITPTPEYSPLPPYEPSTGQ